jgi:hypothetical protein
MQGKAMTNATAKNNTMSLAAYRGDAKTLIAFDILSKAARNSLAGFTVQITPPGKQPYYLQNDLRFEHPDNHAQEPAGVPVFIDQCTDPQIQMGAYPRIDSSGLEAGIRAISVYRHSALL